MCLHGLIHYEDLMGSGIGFLCVTMLKQLDVGFVFSTFNIRPVSLARLIKADFYLK
jgi:hypothetical protein